MTQKPSALERAFDLARSGEASSIAAIKTILRREGYGDAQIIGPQLLRQLRVLIYETEHSGRLFTANPRSDKKNGSAEPFGP
jgi:hypothetical protein